MDFALALDTSIYSLMWILFSLFIGIALAIDIGILNRIAKLLKKTGSKYNTGNDSLNQETKALSQSSKDQPLQEQREKGQTFRRALIWTVLWISLALGFAGIIFVTLGADNALLFVTGYAIEKSLSVDNMFVFLLIFSSLAIPHIYQHKVLMAGILSAIIMRVGLILAGVSLLESFHWMIYIFGGLLLFTAIRMLIQKKNEHGEKKEMTIEKNIAVRIMKKFVPITFELDNDKFLLRKNNNNGHKLLYATPMLVALVIVEMTDL